MKKKKAIKVWKPRMLIGIVHHPSNDQFLKNLVKSMKGVKYPVRIVVNDVAKYTKKQPFKAICNPKGGFDLGALRLLFETTDYDQIFLIQDSFEIKKLDLFDIAAHCPGSFAVSKGFFHYTGKYQRKIAEKIGIPITQTKMDAVYYEYHWSMDYAKTDKKIAMMENALSDDMKEAHFETKFGRKNLVLENEYIKKYKGHWNHEML